MNTRMHRIVALTAAATLLQPATGMAGPGELADSPLYLGTNAPPNIMFIIDDSGSMDWEVMTTDTANGGLFTGTQPDGSSPADSGSVKHRDSQADGNEDGNADCGFGDGNLYGYLYGVEFGNNTYGDNAYDCNTADDQAWRFRNSRFNRLYFDPEKTYTPWSGVDINGNAFDDIDISNAPNNPYNPTEHIDLTAHNADWGGGTTRNTSDRDGDGSADGFRYYTWNDLDGDGLFDDGEETEHLIKNADAETQQNFANWFSYYRSREFVAKAAYGRIIASAEDVRMGLATINQNNSVNTAIADISGDPASGAKRALLDALYSVHSDGGTPLRTAFEGCGDYLECASNSLGFSDCPALAEADGGNCQQNFTIAMTDGFYNGSFSGIGNTDQDGAGPYDGGAYADPWSDTLADIAMDFYERDLQSGLPDNVPTTPGIDENPAQHMVTYTVAFGVDGTLTASPTDPEAAFSWPDPGNGDAQKIDDLRHAAYNGRGLYLSAQDPDALIQSLSDAVGDINDRAGTAASVAFNTSSLRAGSVVFLAVANPANWSGHLLAWALDETTGELVGDPLWDAADELDKPSVNASNRTIVTYDGTQGVPFQWGSLNATQQADLQTNPSGTADDVTTAQERLAYIRGDRSNEGKGLGFRIRGSRLGDIVHAAPVFAGDPELEWPNDLPFPSGAASYKAFKTSTAREGVVYAGANDGMLHGFDEDGQEVLAYIPGNLFSTEATEGLHQLTNPNYSHRYYVDLTPTISDVYINSGWTTVLVGGQRGGGRGMFALDITDPGAFKESNADNLVLWEFDGGDDPDLGYTFSRPSIVPLPKTVTSGTVTEIEWYAVFGNGYNNTGDGTAKLFLVRLDGGAGGTWSKGSDYRVIETGVGAIANGDCTDAGSNCNGLSSPALVDTNGDGVGDRAYAGDLFGNLWAFDLSGEPGTWGVALKSGNSATPLFQTPANQPITSAPSVVRHPTVAHTNSNDPNLLVMFGTGQYLVDADNSTTDTQSFYVVWDTGVGALGQSDLQVQSISRSGTTRLVTDDEVGYQETGQNKQYGCYFDLPDSGERLVTDPLVRDEIVFFNTTVPDAEVCAAGGYGWLMSVDYSNCGTPDDPVFDVSGDDAINQDDLIGDVAPVGEVFQGGLPAGPSVLSDKRYTPGTKPDEDEPMDVTDIENLGGGTTGRLSWEEMPL